MERRKHRRVPLQVQSYLLGNSHEIEGHTLDLSLGGAKFESELAVFPCKTIMGQEIVFKKDSMFQSRKFGSSQMLFHPQNIESA